MLPEITGSQMQARANHLDNCRSKRNLTDYDRAGEIAEAEAEEILAEARAFRTQLLEWLRANHPELLPTGIKQCPWHAAD